MTDTIDRLRAENERLRKALVDAERVLDWGEPEPKPVLHRVRAALAPARKEGE